MATLTLIFKSDRTQVVLLPEDVAFPEGVREVEIARVGDSWVISPLADGGTTISQDRRMYQTISWPSATRETSTTAIHSEAAPGAGSGFQ